MNRTGIEWCDYTWNPLGAGCSERCGATPEQPEGWCYAYRMRHRFKPGVRADGTTYGCQLCYEFVPHLHPERLDQPAKVKSPRIVFAGSMGEMFDPELTAVERERVWVAMRAAPWHHYVVLTKRPDLIDAEELVRFSDDLNLWLGVSVTSQPDWWRVDELLLRWDCGSVGDRHPFEPIISFEPLLGPIGESIPREVRWVIVGAQTGPGAVLPDDRWVTRLGLSTAVNGVPLFEKDNLQAMTTRLLMQRWPEAMVRETTGRAAGGGD